MGELADTAVPFAHMTDHAVHRLRHRGREDRRSVRDALEQFGLFTLRPFAHPLHPGFGERVVGDDVLVGDAEATEQQHRQQSGSVLPRSAVEHGRERTRFAQLHQRFGQTLFALVEDRQVGTFEEVGGVVFTLCFIGSPRVGDHRHVVERHRVLVERERAALVEFGPGAQVDHRSHTEFANHRHIGRSEPIEAVGAEQATPACGAAIDGRIPADVAEVVHGIEPNQSPGVATDIGELAALHISTVPSAVARRPTAR